MRAAVYLGPKNIQVQRVPMPKCGPGEIRIKVGACAICGTDMRIYTHGQKNVVPPAITGHEIAGVIDAVGAGVEGYKVGQKATIVTPVGCGHCKFCIRGIHNLCVDFKAIGYDYPGGFAEYVTIGEKAVRQGNVIVMPAHVPDDEASLVEPLSCVLNGQEYLNIGVGDTVTVIGAGPIGLMHLELARAKGATKLILIEWAKARLEVAKEKFPADTYICSADEDPVKRVIEATDGVGTDVAIVACGVNQCQEQAIAMTAKMGRVSFFAGLPKDKPTITFDSNTMHYKEISVFGAFASHASQYVQALALIAARKVDARKFITKHFSLENMVEGIVGYKAGTDHKMVVVP